MTTVSPSFAVLMPAYNAAATILTALNSVSLQSLRPAEIIVVDDGSSDATREILSELQQPMSLTVLRNKENLGIARSLNLGAKEASAEYIARLDADDAWTPDHLSSIGQLLAVSNHVMACSCARYVDSLGATVSFSKPLSDSTVRRRLLWDNPIVHSSAVFHRLTFQACGGYAEDVKWEDYDLWIRLISKGSFGCTNRATVSYTVSSASLSRTDKRAALEARWRCQKSAANAFFLRHPIAACASVVLARARLSLIDRRSLARH